MTTRISKIARLPHEIREQLNRRIQHGQMGRTIVPWLNDLPETKETMVEYFDSRTITHQNLSEWRRTGYQDWLQHQDRLLWFERLSDQETELEEHNHTGDGFETMGSFFLYEIGQALTTLQHIKNPHQRCDRLETLSREFARLQNAFNWSRRVQLEFDKHNVTVESSNSGTGVSPVRPYLGAPASRRQDVQPPTAVTIYEHVTSPNAGGASPSARTVPASHAQPETNAQEILKSEDSRNNSSAPSSFCILPSALPKEERQRAGALQDAPRNPGAQGIRASVPDCGSPLPLPKINSQTPKLLNSQTLNEFQPMPIPAPPTPLTQQFTPRFLEEINKIRKTRNSQPPQRGRRFICIEG